MTKYFRVRLIPVMGLALLGSCISVNNISPPPSRAELRRAEQIEDRADDIIRQNIQSNPVAVIEARGNTCQLYKLPKFPTHPKKPITEIAALQDGDQDKLDQIAQDYMKALERYNLTVSRLIQQSYADYLDKCVKSLPMPAK